MKVLAKQNSQKTLAYRNATFCADAYAGKELPLRIRVTPIENYYLARYEVGDLSCCPSRIFSTGCDAVTSRRRTLNQASAFGINPS